MEANTKPHFRIHRSDILRGVLAVMGLFVAFAAALLSTVAANAGQFWPSVVLASSSLLLAGVVGILTVPLLARRVFASRINEVLRYEMTREGTVYLILVLVIGIAALNTGNNLLYVVLAALLAAMVVSGMTSAYMLRGLRAELVVPEQVFARQSAMGTIRVVNERRLSPALSLSVVGSEPGTKATWRLEKSRFRFPPKRPQGREWFSWADLSLRKVKVEQKKGILQTSTFFPYIGPRTSIRYPVELKFDRRGRYVQERLGLVTRIPFAFLKKSRFLRSDSELIVFPSIEATDEFYELLPIIAGEIESFVRGRGFELYRIRDYSPQDDARYLDWKASARSGELKLREFAKEDERKLRFVFDNPLPERVPSAAYESGIEIAASLAWHFAQEDADISYVAQGFHARDVSSFLRYLALVAPEEKQSILDELPVAGVYNVIVTAKPRGSIETALWSSSYVIFMDS